jgi:DnaJ homolog subfamily C member 2
MATVLAITTPPLPKSYSPSSISSSSRLSPVVHRTLLPVGPAHLNYLRLALHHNHDFSALDAHLESERQAKDKLFAAGNAGSEDDLGVGDEEETAELLALDPKEWKVLEKSSTFSTHH